jgi:hypothetical protein
MDKYPNPVNIVKVRSNRKFYRSVKKEIAVRSKGHPEWYGEEFRLGNPSTWGSTDASVEYPIVFKNGRQAVAIDFKKMILARPEGGDYTPQYISDR